MPVDKSDWTAAAEALGFQPSYIQVLRHKYRKLMRKATVTGSHEDLHAFLEARREWQDAKLDAAAWNGPPECQFSEM